MYGFLIKTIKEEKSWIKLIQDLRGLVKGFSILASTESLVMPFFGVSMVSKLCIFQT